MQMKFIHISSGHQKWNKEQLKTMAALKGHPQRTPFNSINPPQQYENQNGFHYASKGVKMINLCGGNTTMARRSAT